MRCQFTSEEVDNLLWNFGKKERQKRGKRNRLRKLGKESFTVHFNDVPMARTRDLYELWRKELITSPIKSFLKDNSTTLKIKVLLEK